MERTRWTDDRIDDLVVRLDAGLADFREETRSSFQELRSEIRALRQETREDNRALRADLSAFQRQATQIGWALVGALLVALMTILISAI